jgi:AcrR family transcriptional regulator
MAMSRTRAASRQPENLHREFVQAARRYIARHGHLSLSLRALAERVGVTTAAPYYHFADRRALLLAVAVEGFEELIDGARTRAAAAGEPRAQLTGLGEWFIQFTSENAHLTTLMYESELTSPVVDPALGAFQDAGHRQLEAIMLQARGDLGPVERSIRVAAYWSAIYGFAMLHGKCMLQPYEPTDRSEAQFTLAVIQQAVRAALAD